MNLASIYASIGPSGVALVFVGCAGLYLALRNLLYLHFVWRDFKRDFSTLSIRKAAVCAMCAIRATIR